MSKEQLVEQAAAALVQNWNLHEPDARRMATDVLATLPEPEVVTDEVARVAVNAYDRATGEGWQMPCVQGMRSALEAALPYLAPAAPEFTEKHGLDLRGIKVGEILTDDQWQAVCAFVQEQDAIIDAYEERAMAAPAGEVVGEAGTMPGTTGFTMAVFESSKVPVGTKLYTENPQPAPAAQGKDAEVVAAGERLVELVEGPGCLRWEDGQGFRLKDTAEWAVFYVAIKRALTTAAKGVPAQDFDAEFWKKAWVEERARAYRREGMAIEQAKIHAETDAALMEQAARQQEENDDD